VSDYPKPLPVATPESQPFWDACRRHELALQRCDACCSFWFPPGPLCPRCHSAEWRWTPTSGRGTVYSFAVVHRVYHPGFSDSVPYAVAVVELDEGPRLPTEIVGVPVDGIRCDLPVEVAFEDVTSDVTLPKFRPRAAG